MNISEYDINSLLTSFSDTLVLLLIVGAFVIVLGLILGVFMFITSNDYIVKRNKAIIVINKILSIIIDICRSLPFLVLLIILIPLSIFLTGEMIGVKGAIPPLIISAAPFFSRIVTNALNDVPKGTIEATKAMGASVTRTMIILVKEALPSLVAGLTVTLITLVGFIASAGAIGAGGLGQYAIRNAEIYKYHLTFMAVVLILAIVFIIQFSGDFITKKIDRR